MRVAAMMVFCLGMVLSASLKDPQQPLVPEAAVVPTADTAAAAAAPDTASVKQTTEEPPMPPPYNGDDNKAPEPAPATDAPAASESTQESVSVKEPTTEPPMPLPHGSNENKPAPTGANVVAEKPVKAKESHPEVYPVNEEASKASVPTTPAFTPPKGLNKKMAKVTLQADNLDLKNENTKLKMAVEASQNTDKHATASTTEAPHAGTTAASTAAAAVHTRQEQIEAAIKQEEDAVHAASKAKLRADAAPTQDQHDDAPAQAEPADTTKPTEDQAPKTSMLNDPALTGKKLAEPAVAARVMKEHTKLTDAVGSNVINMLVDGPYAKDKQKKAGHATMDVRTASDGQAASKEQREDTALVSDGPGTISGYSFTKLNVNTDGHLAAPVSVCFKGGTQWWRHAKSNFAHMVRGLVVPAYSMMREKGFLHPDVQIYLEEEGADHQVIRDAFSMFMRKPLQKAQCDSTVHTHVMAFDETEFLEKDSGVGVVRGDASCNALKKDMFSDIFHATRVLNAGKVQLRADRPKLSVYVSKRTSGRDLSDWDGLVSQLRSKEGLAVETGDIGSLPFQEQVFKAANTDIMIMHHGAANNHRFWMAPDSVLIETQPPDSWFCGHAFGDDQVNYVLSMNNPKITAGECNPGQSLDQCSNANCNMYEQPKSEFVKRKDATRSIDGSGANRIVELVGSLQAARSQGDSFKETITKFGQSHNGWTRTACRGVATQLVENDATNIGAAAKADSKSTSFKVETTTTAPVKAGASAASSKKSAAEASTGAAVAQEEPAAAQTALASDPGGKRTIQKPAAVHS